TMRKKLLQYNKNIQIEILSNAVFLKSSNVHEFNNNENDMTIGFLSNISFEKGIKEYFEVLKKLIKDGYSVNGLIAGSNTNIKSKKYLDSNLEELKEICYLGKIVAKEKEDFLNKIDLLLLPTKYKNEAEPLVIHEAMSHGIVVIAWNRGCISNMISQNTGLVIEKDKQYVNSAVNQIIFWIENPKKLIIAKELSLKQFIHKKSENLAVLNKIISNIANYQ
ncbi:MAG: glycosyltransferase, partial [Planctomycetia bacterium]|nr:glycosyltransferase [Planctomycetia bacterium]